MAAKKRARRKKAAARGKAKGKGRAKSTGKKSTEHPKRKASKKQATRRAEPGAVRKQAAKRTSPEASGKASTELVYSDVLRETLANGGGGSDLSAPAMCESQGLAVHGERVQRGDPLALLRPPAAGREAVARATGLHEYSGWEESRIRHCADRQIEDEEDPPVNRQLAHVILEVAHARIDPRASLAPRAGRLATEQRARCDQEKNL